MDIFMSALIKMSIRGVVIILVVLLVRLLLKKLRIGHKYILGLWVMVFLYFVFPWKLSLPVGFWNNASVSEVTKVISGLQLVTNERCEGVDNTSHIVNSSGLVDNTMVNVPAIIEENTVKPVTAISMESAELNGKKENSSERIKIGSLIEIIWLVGLCSLFGHTIYSYFSLKRTLRLSVLYKDNIWLAENIDIPMVFGLVRSKIYLPISMEFENLSYVITHEKTHIKRKDGLIKMIAYIVCLIHWFNPFIWIAYFLFGSDMEKACDEEVIRTMGREKRKEYAYALLHIATENDSRKKRVFVAPICFNEGNVKSRIRNIMKYRYTIPGIGAAVVIAILLMSAMFMTEAKGSDIEKDVKTEDLGEEPAAEDNEVNKGPYMMNGEKMEDIPAFYVEDSSVLQIGKSFSLEDYYITSRYTASNYYFIDEDGVLWGTGKNEFGQLGTGTYGLEEYYEYPVKIAENVLSVDASWNDYFCIYLTEDGELYGIGLNYSGLLLGKGSESKVYSQDDFQRVTEPVLLMSDVAYARAGLECIVVLQNNQTAYWWGQYAPTTHTSIDVGRENYWKMEEDASNPAKMFSIEPIKIMEHCRYVTTGMFSGAAISESGELYTWGFNAFGECGTPVTEDDFVRTPIKVMDNVKMVWQGRIVFSDPISQSPEFKIWETDYEYNTFVLKEDNSLLAVGLNLGNKEKVTESNGNLVETQVNHYSSDFVPIQVVIYSVNKNLTILSKLQFGMSIDEVEEIMNSANMTTFHSDDESVYSEGYAVCLSAQYNQYHCYFNSQNKLVRITIQEGGSRDGRFALGMSFSDLAKVVEGAGGFLTKVDNDFPYDIWVYQDQVRQIQYEFRVYEGSVSVVSELVISGISN